jgi:hypothetical protein
MLSELSEQIKTVKPSESWIERKPISCSELSNHRTPNDLSELIAC